MELTDLEKTIQEKYNHLVSEINRFSNNSPPKIIAVSKTFPKEVAEAAYNIGIRIFGENKVKEGIDKFKEIREKHNDVELHHIGPTQSGTIKKVIQSYDYVHGVGSKSSAFELIKSANVKKTKIKFFLQFNLTDEISKSGFSKDDGIFFLDELQKINSEYAKLVGIMTMGPSNEDLKETRKVFKELFSIKKNYFQEAELSMGMSGDYQIAIEEGSNCIRIGSSIFGTRSII